MTEVPNYPPHGVGERGEMCAHGGGEDDVLERGPVLRSAYAEGSNAGLMHVCDLNMTGSSVINALLKCSPWRHPTFLRDANSRRMMNQFC